MKLFKTIFFALCLSTSLALTVKTYGQTKVNTNFTAGVAALDANNMPLAYKKFLAAAKEGHLDSQFNVALMYEKGMGVGKNEKEALIWYNKASEQGNVNAQFNLGVFYENGKGTPIDYAKANKWYRRAALQKDGLAIGNLGMLYIRGQGVKMNKVAGMSLLLLSIKIDQTPENNAKNNITATRDLTVNMIKEAQSLSDKMSNSKNILLPLDQYLKK
ncbi:tetratricopeptide repeat protein [Flavobacterium sp. 5]|uniref:tetratricopeptide repeat protein n=1 Tax=Flavobacterium sp. 5 TaxID=2035199 RepID=UPI000CA87DC1|nr:tetratricopeptide repeat protein [Flavobacterium sp. 5]PKB17668.1 Sel1 repeat-containing protein [Flavobacterium sp. 5]